MAENNKAMLNSIVALTQNTCMFIGGLHLVGTEGILALLQQKGATLTRVPLEDY